jgi:hypothetical protein
VTFFFGEIAKGREGERVQVIDAPGQFGRVERGRDFVFDRLTESLRQVVVVAALRIERTVEGQFILDDRTADADPGVNFRKAVRRDAGERQVFRFTNQILGREISVNFAAEFVGPALGDNVEDTAGRQSVFGAV